MTSEDTAPAETAVNPYASPGVTTAREPPRTRWRFIPTSLMVTYGMMGVIFSIVVLSRRSYMLIVYGYGSGAGVAAIIGAVLLAAGSVLWIFAAVLCWKRDWGSMIPVFAIAFVMTSVGQYLL